MNERDRKELRALTFTERNAIYQQAGVWLTTVRTQRNGDARARGGDAALEWARTVLRNIETTYASCTSKEDVIRVLGMEQTVVQFLAIGFDALVVPDDFDYESLFVPHVGQGEG